MSFWNKDNSKNICGSVLQSVTGRTANGLDVFVVSESDELKLKEAGYDFKAGEKLIP